MAVSVEYISVACNQTPHSADWNSNGLLAYGAGNSIALAKAHCGKLEKVVFMLHGHGRRVNCVRWISANSISNDPLLVSGAVDGNVIVWKCIDQTSDKYGVDEILSSHSGSINCLAGICQEIKEQSTTIIVSGSSDCTAKVWEKKSPSSVSKFQLVQTVSFGRGFIMGVDVHCFDGHLILACGTDVGTIEIYTRQSDQFIKVMSLVGHEDWIRDIHFTNEGNGCLLASCSQDAFIRLWKLYREGPELITPADDLKLTENSFTLLDGDGIERKYIFTLESVLIGHEEWVYSVRWRPRHDVSEQPCLLSASMDKTMVLWSFDAKSGLWMEQVRVGDVGGNSLGLYGAVFGPKGDYILAHGYQGEFHLWKEITLGHWQYTATIGGHYGPVQDIAWEPSDGEFLASVSVDQTTRIHAPWVVDGVEVTWREIARPQIHGYNMQCICMLSSVLFVSGADEKILRVFHSPRKFVDNLLNISKVKLQLNHTDFPSNASVPSLGLSNKAVFSTESPITLSTVSTDDKNSSETEIPFKDQLQATLWPEIHKLYGHSYEIFCIASSPDGKFVASACMASKKEYAAILIWDTSRWHQVQTLTHHTLTVTQLAFSYSSKLLLAVSRDRTWSLWRQKNGSFYLEARLDKSTHSYVHNRIIWSCSWTHDDAYFSTGSRDKKAILWSVVNDDQQFSVACVKMLQFVHAVTALDFAPFEHGNKYLLAIGLESGEILVYGCCITMKECNLLVTLDPIYCHVAAVKKLKWRPNCNKISLASCSLDHCVKIFNITV